MFVLKKAVNNIKRGRGCANLKKDMYAVDTYADVCNIQCEYHVKIPFMLNRLKRKLKF